MSDLERIIFTALTVQDNNIRAQAEKEIYNMVQLNYTDFFQAIVDIIQNHRNDGILRTGAATIFKRLIAFKVYFP